MTPRSSCQPLMRKRRAAPKFSCTPGAPGDARAGDAQNVKGRTPRCCGHNVLKQAHGTARGDRWVRGGGLRQQGDTIMRQVDSLPGSAAKPTVLVVDDTPTNLALMVEILHPQYHTRVAINGLRALELLAAGPPVDLILLDVMMPGLDGYEVCARLKADPSTRHVPVIFISAMSEEQDETKGLDLDETSALH